MEKPVFLMIEATPNPAQKEAMHSYLSQAPIVTSVHGGVPLATYNVENTLDGQEAPAIFAVVSFPNRNAIDALFSDPAYQALVVDRDLGFSHIRYHIVHEKL